MARVVMSNIINNVINSLHLLPLETLVLIRSYIDGTDGNSFSATCRNLAAADSAYRSIEAEKIFKAVGPGTSLLSRLIQPLASLNLTTRAGLCEFNNRIVKVFRQFRSAIPLNRVFKAEAVTAIAQKLQAFEDRALAKVWPRIYEAARAATPSINLDPYTMSAQDIRNWMNANPTILLSIHQLNLSGMELCHLPKEIGLLANLQKLLLDNNRLISLPNSVCRLANLHTLSLDNNQLTRLPESFGQLANLQMLRLNNNRLTALPESFGQLTKLLMIYLNDNHLTALPESFGQLANLQMLYLNNNHLTALPESIGLLANLQLLNIENNQLTALPSYISRINHLYTDGNPLVKNSSGT